MVLKMEKIGAQLHIGDYKKVSFWQECYRNLYAELKSP